MTAETENASRSAFDLTAATFAKMAEIGMTHNLDITRVRMVLWDICKEQERLDDYPEAKKLLDQMYMQAVPTATEQTS
jgi:hypothetical protein